MKRMMGFFGSYCDGSSPSRIPPCGLARSVLEGLAALEATLVTVCVTVDMVGGLVVLSSDVLRWIRGAHVSSILSRCHCSRRDGQNGCRLCMMYRRIAHGVRDRAHDLPRPPRIHRSAYARTVGGGKAKGSFACGCGMDRALCFHRLTQRLPDPPWAEPGARASPPGLDSAHSSSVGRSMRTTRSDGLAFRQDL